MIRFIMLPFVGFLVGLLIISLGGGGGLFYVGILTALFNIPPEIAASTMGCGALEAVGTSVLVLLGISITGFAMHLGLNNVHWNLLGLLLSGTVLGAFTGPVLLAKIDRAKMEKFLQPVLLVMVLVMGISLLFK